MPHAVPRGASAMLTLTSSPLPHHLLCMAGAEETKAKPPPLIYSTPFATKHGTHAAHEHQPPRSRTRSVASPAMDMELLLVLLLFLAIPVVLPAPVRLELARVDANLTGHDLIRRAVQRSLDRPGVAVPRPGGGGGAATAADGGRRSSAAAPVVAGGGEYLVKLGIGTPQHFFSAAIDTATGEKEDCLCFIEVVAHKDDTSKELLEWGSRVCSANSRPPNPQ